MSAAEVELACPVAVPDEAVTMAHGGGGLATRRLVRGVFQAALKDPELERAHDGAALEGGLACTTDSFVVRPLFFPGGDIGSLAVHGTANDLAMCGAEPLYMTAGFILEEGVPFETLRRVAASMARAAAAAGLRVVAGDTKVVERGKGDGVYVSAAGVGRLRASLPPDPREIREGDSVVLSGDVGAHGAAILSVREGLGFETELVSDSCCVWPEVRSLIEAGVELHCLRDLTRGGLAAALNELAETSGLGLSLDEAAIPVRPEVAAACEVFGLDPLTMACEGRFVALVPGSRAEEAAALLRRAFGRPAAVIGRAVKRHAREVRMLSRIGVERVLDMPLGEPLPRIC